MTTEIDFPLDSFREAATHLRRPFTAEAVKFKVQATYPKNEPTGAIVVGYIDARLAVERLNLIVPHLWYDEYQRIEGAGLLCKLTVDGITRSDVGDGGATKAGFSDALKRAAVKFGIGVSLYAIPQTHLSLNDGHVKRVRGRDGESLGMLASGERLVRDRYRQWLDTTGVKAFGDPLSHGDVEGAQGDIETDTAQEAVAEQQAEPILDDARVTEIVAALGKSQVLNEDVRKQLIIIGVADVPEVVLRDEDRAINRTPLRKLTEKQAEALLNWLPSREPVGASA